jgi:hypothetical protein
MRPANRTSLLSSRRLAVVPLVLAAILPIVPLVLAAIFLVISTVVATIFLDLLSVHHALGLLMRLKHPCRGIHDDAERWF